MSRLKCDFKVPIVSFYVINFMLLYYRIYNILSVNEKLPVSKFIYFGKYIMQLFGYCYVHVSSQRQADLER